MKVRVFDIEEDYEITEGWRAGHGQAPLPKDMLSNVLGTVVSDDDGTDIAAAWLYRDSGRWVAWIAWTVTSPTVSPMRAVRGINVAEDFLETVAQAEGFGRLIGMFKQDSMVRHFERLGFVRHDTDVGHFLTLKTLAQKQEEGD